MELKRIWKQFFRFIILYLFVGIVAASIAFFYYRSLRPTFVAKYTFVVDESSGTSNSGLGMALGQLGIGSLNPTGFNLDRVLEYGRSRYVIKNVLEDSIATDAGTYLIANYLINYLELKEKWSEGMDNDLAKFERFTFGIDEKNRTHGLILNTLRSSLLNPTQPELEVDINFNIATGIFTITAISEDESLSYALASAFFDNLKKIYTKEILEKDSRVLKIVETKLDSVNQDLVQAESSLQRYRDRMSRVMLAQDKTKEFELQRDLVSLRTMQSDLSRNVELTKFKLLTTTPVFKPIDPPIYPVSRDTPSLFRLLAIGGLVTAAIVGIHQFILFQLFSKKST